MFADRVVSEGTIGGLGRARFVCFAEFTQYGFIRLRAAPPRDKDVLTGVCQRVNLLVGLAWPGPNRFSLPKTKKAANGGFN